jgi:murein L,D-transpeptidase YcbB/YkuD
MAVAATFLTVSATSAMAQSDPARNSAAELAIDAAVPRPEPANVPPPTINDFKLDGTAPAADAVRADAPKSADKAADKAPEAKPADVVTAPAADINKADTAKRDTAVTTPAAPPPAAAAAAPAAEPVKAASNVPAADQPVADKLKELLGGKSARYFDRKVERAAIEKFYTARDFAPLWTQSGALSATGKGVVARLKDASSDGLNPADYPVPDFTAASNPDALADADLKLTASMMD